MDGAKPAGVAAAPGRLSIAVPRPYFCDRLDEDAAAALRRAGSALVEAGHEVVDVEIEHAAWTPEVYLHIVLPEASWYHAPLLRHHATRYSPGVRLRLEMGRYVLAEDYVRAMRLRDALVGCVDRALSGRDALMLPTLPMATPRLGAHSVTIGGRDEPVRSAMLRLTQLFNLTGHPAIALPAGRGRDGLPRGLQLVGHRHETRRLLTAAGAVERQISGGAGSVGGGAG
jgi:aspartyl-tRNA(Asn)/glutamyl-tRNA(Gln) amidotransferase subunit A